MRGECPNPRPDCRYAREGCFSDTHHNFYPGHDYKTPTEKAFRQLPENKEQLCRAEHDERHFTEPTPIKPSRDEMLGAIALSKGQAT